MILQGDDPGKRRYGYPSPEAVCRSAQTGHRRYFDLPTFDKEAATITRQQNNKYRTPAVGLCAAATGPSFFHQQKSRMEAFDHAFMATKMTALQHRENIFLLTGTVGMVSARLHVDVQIQRPFFSTFRQDTGSARIWTHAGPKCWASWQTKTAGLSHSACDFGNFQLWRAI